MGYWPSFAGDDLEVWREWAVQLFYKADTALNLLTASGQRTPATHRQMRHLKDVKTRADLLISAQGEWAWDVQTGRYQSVTFAPIWPTEYVRPMLFGKVPKILLLSATLSRKSLELLDVDEGAPFYSTPSTFPPENTPIRHVNSIFVKNSNSPGERQHWVDRIDQIIKRQFQFF